MSKATEFALEDDVPIPTAHNHKRKYPFNEMEVGQSFFVSNSTRDPSTVRSAMAAASRQSKGKRKFVSRTYEDGIRVWRVK